jgi:hypothetical protein
VGWAPRRDVPLDRRHLVTGQEAAQLLVGMGGRELDPYLWSEPLEEVWL